MVEADHEEQLLVDVRERWVVPHHVIDGVVWGAADDLGQVLFQAFHWFHDDLVAFLEGVDREGVDGLGGDEQPEVDVDLEVFNAWPLQVNFWLLINLLLCSWGIEFGLFSCLNIFESLLSWRGSNFLLLWFDSCSPASEIFLPLFFLVLVEEEQGFQEFHDRWDVAEDCVEPVKENPMAALRCLGQSRW